MDVKIVVVAGSVPDELASLHGFLRAEDALRGSTQLAFKAPRPGTLGAELDSLLIHLGADLVTVIGAVTGVLIAWIRQRKSTVKIEVQLGDARIELEAKRIRELDAAKVNDLAKDIVDILSKKCAEAADR